MTRPLARLKRETRAIADGDLDREVTVVGTRDEIGTLTRSIREMKDRLVRSLKETRIFRTAVEHAGNTVTVRVGRLPDGGFFVEDDGPGLPAEKREQIFDAGCSTRENGTGLGLSIVKTIAETHGWSLSVANGHKGGARFEFSDVERV